MKLNKDLFRLVILNITESVSLWIFYMLLHIIAPLNFL